MVKNYILILLVLGALTTSGCDKLTARFKTNRLNEYNASAGITAAQWFPFVLKEALKWQPDAKFYGIPESNAGLSGESSQWSYLFSSESSNKQIQITIKHGYVTIDKNPMNVLPPVSRWTLDSPGAIQAGYQLGANKFLAKYPKAELVMSLFGKVPGTRDQKNVWILKYVGETESFVIAINANTGEKVFLPGAN
jgi:hypothetical protein